MLSALICVADQEAGSMHTLAVVSVVAGQGIVGDSNYSMQKYPGQSLTPVETEEIERFEHDQGTAMALTVTRRNLVTRGVRLNTLVGREFRIGSVTVRGVELCEPGATLGRSPVQPGMSAAAVVRALTQRCGLRADVLTCGTISLGEDNLA